MRMGKFSKIADVVEVGFGVNPMFLWKLGGNGLILALTSLGANGVELWVLS
jgi:hypothetical protein